MYYDVSNEEIIDFAAGNLKQKPNDQATWNSQNAKFQPLGLFNGADTIKEGDLWETGVGKAKKILIEGQWTDNMVQDIIYKNLNLSNKERSDIMSGYTPPGKATTTSAKSNVKLGKSYADKNAALAAVGSSNKKPIKIGKKWYLQ